MRAPRRARTTLCTAAICGALPFVVACEESAASDVGDGGAVASEEDGGSRIPTGADAANVDASPPPADDAGPDAVDAGPDASDAPISDLAVTLSATQLVIVIAGKARTVTSVVSGGKPPYAYTWRVDGAAHAGTVGTLDVGTLPIGDHALTLDVQDAVGVIRSSAAVPVHVLPTQFDWSHQLRPSAPPAAGDWLTPVKNQLSCGSCWAYAAVAAMEARYNIQQNDPNLDVDLSEQDLIDCWTGAVGCGGGAPEQALDGYVRTKGIPTEVCRPTLGHNDVCKATCADGSTPARWKIGAFSFGPALSDPDRLDWIRDEIVHLGPMARAFEGIYDWNPSTFVCDGGQGSHFVTVVGYDDVAGHWLLRNSWGPTWNGNGYFETKYGACAVDKGGSTIGAVIPP